MNLLQGRSRGRFPSLRTEPNNGPSSDRYSCRKARSRLRLKELVDLHDLAHDRGPFLEEHAELEAPLKQARAYPQDMAG